MRTSFVFVALSTALLGTGAVLQHNASADEHASHAHLGPADALTAPGIAQQAGGLPAGLQDAAARIAASPRKADWKIIKVGAADSVIAWVVEPSGSARAPVVIVIHENMGLNTWTRAVADQLAADGFIAIAPDLITMKRPPGTDLTSDWGRAGGPAISSLTNEEAQRSLDAVAAFGSALPNSNGKYGIVGFCWGGARSFLHAVHAPSLGASVVYYGTSPTAEQMAAIRAPVLGLYGGNDARITSAVPATDSAMKRLGKTFEFHVFEGAGHGFLRGQDQLAGANLAASRAAWPLTVAWFRKHLAEGSD